MFERDSWNAPIQKRGRYLVAMLPVVPDDDFQQLCNELVERVGKDRSYGVVVDVSGLDVIDAFAARTLSTMAQMVQLRGAKPVIVGIQPEVALTMVRQGLSFGRTATALNLEVGLSYLDTQTGYSRSALAQGVVASGGLGRMW
ncbi:MAG: STAS domain-containing protein [Chloroflexi bacterium]|nr:STAS domain-containing protein [Chloroflexota bacterium]